MSEFLHKTNETVILHVQADMLGYHGVSSKSKRQTDSSPVNPCSLVYPNRKSPSKPF
jgi:hypothetical protein